MLWQPWKYDGRPLIALWVAIHLALLGTALSSGSWPWRMFAAPAVHRPVVLADARVGGGPWESLPLEQAFGYTRGWTDLRVPDESKILMDGRVHHKKRAVFARWLVQRVASDAGYTQVRLRLTRAVAGDGPPRITRLGQFEVAP